MNSNRLSTCYLAMAIGGGLFVAVLSVFALAALNRHVIHDEQAEAGIRTISLEGGGSGAPKTGDGNDASQDSAPAGGEEEIMKVDLTAPQFDAPAVAALDLNPAMPAPSVDSIKVFVGYPGTVPPSGGTIESASLSRGVPGGSGTGTGRGNGNGGGGSGGTAGIGNGGTGNGTGIGNADTVDQPPREISATKPRYPQRESQLGIEGTVVMEILIDERGRVADVRFISGAESFRRAVMEVVHTWRYEPARHQGRVVKVWGSRPVNFNHPRNRG
jgi:TonB family protein